MLTKRAGFATKKAPWRHRKRFQRKAAFDCPVLTNSFPTAGWTPDAFGDFAPRDFWQGGGNVFLFGRGDVGGHV